VPRVPWCAATERARLCDLLDQHGPDAATLCTGWDTGHLAAHLVLRDRALTVLPVLRRGGPAAMARLRGEPFPSIVERIRRGGLLPHEGRLGEALHLLEFVVHRQDVLRAHPADAAPVDGAHTVDEATSTAVFDQLRRRAGLLGGPVPAGVGLLLRSYRHGTIEVRRGPAVVVVDGEPVELVLWLFGRVADARVVVARRGGPVDLVARVEATLRR
jgi:uncharacterized protein (TIGR03085 family)